MDERYYEYRTGRTEPKKSRSGPIAFLLILVIFFSGVVCAMGLMNIRLSLWLNDGNTDSSAPLSFSQEKADGVPNADMPTPTEQSLQVEGMTCRELSVLWQKLYELPTGVYIAQVENGSCAEVLGIAPGDVLISFAGTPVSGLDMLQSLLDSRTHGAAVEIVTYRNGQQNKLTLTLDD